MGGREEATPGQPANARLRLILVRHGESEANVARLLQGQSQGKLTRKGRRSAELLGAHLQSFHIDRVVASDLNRTRETVAGITRSLPSLPVDFSPLVRERNIGELDGQPETALFDALDKWGGSPAEYSPRGGESLQDVHRRAAGFVRELVSDPEGGTVLLVSHGDFLRMVLSVLQEIPIEAADRIYLDNTSYTIADYDGQRKWVIHTFNSTAHLDTA